MEVLLWPTNAICVQIHNPDRVHLPRFLGLAAADLGIMEMEARSESIVASSLYSRWHTSSGSPLAMRAIFVHYRPLLLLFGLLPAIRFGRWIWGRAGERIRPELRPRRLVLHLYTAACMLCLAFAVQIVVHGAELSYTDQGTWWFSVQSASKDESIMWTIGWYIHPDLAEVLAAPSPQQMLRKPRVHEFLGLTFGHEQLGVNKESIWLVTPRGLALAVCFVPTALWLLLARGRWKRNEIERRRRLGLCLNCGYDLRASSERCPECGTARAESAGA